MNYRCIMADPPWNERGGGKIKRGADRHYPLLKTPEIAKVMFRSPMWNPAPNCHLWLWVTNNHLLDGLSVMDALGFRYITNAVWVKRTNNKTMTLASGTVVVLHGDETHGALQIGLGQYMRGSHELLLFGSRGKAAVPGPSNRPPSVFFAERTKHSQKPDEAYELVEKVSPGPRLEMFARNQRDGWDCWGNEVE